MLKEAERKELSETAQKFEAGKKSFQDKERHLQRKIKSQEMISKLQKNCLKKQILDLRKPLRIKTWMKLVLHRV